MSIERNKYNWRRDCDAPKMSRFMAGFYDELCRIMWNTGHYKVGDTDKRVSRIMYDLRDLPEDEKIERLSAYLENLKTGQKVV